MRLLFCFLGCLMATSAALAIEEPKYKVLDQDAGFELRQYAPLIVAETWVDGDMDAASSKGFRIIADYIFGNNKVPQSTQSSKIAMTAPVLVQPAVDASTWLQTKRWRVQFVMPDKYTLESLPLPNSGAVKLREVPAKTVAVAKYSGLNTDSRIRKESQALTDWVQARKLVPSGPPQLARYNPPWALPMFRRNEIQLEIKD